MFCVHFWVCSAVGITKVAKHYELAEYDDHYDGIITTIIKNIFFHY